MGRRPRGATSTMRASPIGSDADGSLAHCGQTAPLEHVGDLRAPLPLAAPPGGERDEVGDEAAAAAAPLERGEDVVLDREPAEGLHSLERAAKTLARPGDGARLG